MPLEHEDIQAFALRAHGELAHAAYLMLGVRDGAAPAACAGLRELYPRVARASQVRGFRGRLPLRLQLAFTHAGLRALGLPGDALADFPIEFREGLAEPARAARLGDDGDAAPDRWRYGGPGLHVLCMLFARTPDALTDAVAGARRLLDPGFVVVADERGRAERIEHFGFRDGIAQPSLVSDRPDAADVIADGEVLLGYPNEYGRRPWSPSVDAATPGAEALAACHPESLCSATETERGTSDPARAARRRDLGRNGTYLVFRTLRQDVAGFWRYFAAQAREHGHGLGEDPAEALAAKCIGRWPDGTPLAPHKPGALDAFDYEDDPLGHGCPFGAHVRRANPRASLDRAGGTSISPPRLHRLVRRGRLYGPAHPDPRSGRDDGADRGLFFIALCANLGRQFEFVQQVWLAGRSFAALDQDPDPMVAGGRPGDGLTIPADPFSRRLGDLPRFVTMRGGDYFFLPGLRALGYLANLC